MFLGPIITFFIAAYISIVALGHVLLVIAILKCLHEDFRGGRQAAAANASVAGAVHDE